MTFFFVVRTDVGPRDGAQRVFGVYDTEEDAAAFGMQIAAQRPGSFAVVAGEPVLNLVKADVPVTAEPVTT
jgi:hypothetical protein